MLFRSEAVGHAHRRLPGEVCLATPLGFKVVSLTVLAMLILASSFASMAKYARKETVDGSLVPEGGIIRVVARSSGALDAVHVKEGQLIASGAKLVDIRLAVDLDNGDLSTALSGDLLLEQQAVHARFDADIERLATQGQQAAVERAALTRELLQLDDRVKLQRDRVRLSREQAERLRPIAEKGFLPLRALEEREAEVLSAEDQLLSIGASKGALRRELESVDARIRNLSLEERALQATAASTVAQFSQRRSELQAQASITAIAPIAARVAVLPVTRGQHVEAGSTVAILTPSDADLMAELYVPSSGVGFLRPGQQVRLMYHAFPYQKYGMGKGRISSVSSAPVPPGDAPTQGSTPSQPMFRIRVALEDKHVKAYGLRAPLEPGMLVRAQIIIDRRTLLEWLLDPLYAAGRRS